MAIPTRTALKLFDEETRRRLAPAAQKLAAFSQLGADRQRALIEKLAHFQPTLACLHRLGLATRNIERRRQDR